jgi:protein-S-isoprenylcysteine O-methyltransferase Ste14/pimeloyl-ACP methyl ester carboxylesterase
MRLPIRLIRALGAFLALPGVVAFAIPLLIAWPAWRNGDTPFHLLALLPLLAGIGLLLWCVREFYVAGKGTLAPWDPPRHLVTTGPYRVSRNPMYIAVTAILIGWAIGFGSWALGGYLLVVMVAFVLRVRFGEEPWLAERHYDAWKRYAARTPRWVFRSRRAVAISWATAIVLLLFAGLVYEAYADAEGARAFPPPGKLVDVGGRRLHLLCIGNGDPLVLFEPSGFGSSVSSARARERISTRTRVCSYDRVGMGWSDAGPSSVTFDDLARDLAVLQDRERLPSPMIIVAASIGGLTAETFARKYPERVAGLVLLDAANTEIVSAASQWLRSLRLAACVGGGAAQFGLIRVLDPFHLRGDSSDDGKRGAAITYGAKPWGALCAMARGIPRDLQAVQSLPPLRSDLPLAVLSASSDVDLFPGSSWFSSLGMAARRGEIRAQLVASHQRLAKQSSHGTWTMVPRSTHLIANSQPEAVAAVVLNMLDQLGEH